MKELVPDTGVNMQPGSSTEKIVTNPLSRKISKILETRLENDKAAVEALKELSTFFPENTLRARRNLRGQIERRTVAINQDFVAALREVKEAVDNIYTDVKTINAQCSEMKVKLQAAKAETKHLTEQTTGLHKQRAVLTMQREVATAFTRTFLLSREEEVLLRASPLVIGPAFFAALDRTQQIKADTRHLLQTGHQQTALEVLAASGEAREAAITGLYQWLLQQARLPDSLPAAVPAAMARLEDRPQLFRLVVEEWVVVRQGALNRQFLHSLTHLSPTHSPIELGAHSPTRYVGDMLAWLHQALAGEREVMGALFGGCTTVDINGETCSSVASIAESVCRPLKTRVEQMVVTNEHARLTAAAAAAASGTGERGDGAGSKQDAAANKRPVLLYKMSGLLQFYKNTIQQLAGGGLLVLTLEELQQLSHKLFLAALQTQVATNCDRLAPSQPSLMPSAGVTSLLTLLSDVITAATLGTTSENDHAGQVVEMVVSPLLSALSSPSSSGLSEDPVQHSVYLLNCCHQLHATVALLNTSNAPDKLKQLESTSDGALQQLCEQQVSAVLASLGLLPMLPRLTATDGPTLASTSQCSPAAVHAFLTKLDHFLSQPDAYLLPPLRLLLSSTLRQRALQLTSVSLLQHYSALYHAVHDTQRGGYSDPDRLMPKTPDVIQALMVF